MDAREDRQSASTSRRSSTPPRRAGRFGEWLSLLACILIAGPCFFVFTAYPDAVDKDEAQQLVVAMETNDRITADANDHLVPHLAGRPFVERAPGVTWLQIVVVRTLFGGQPTADNLLLAGRITSALCAMLAVAAVFWAGHSLGGGRAAAIAALVFAASPVSVSLARHATMAMPATSFVLMSVAAALWASRPLKPAPSVERQFIGWVACGLMLGAALLCMGFGAFAFIVVPVVVMLTFCPGRTSHLLGLVAALIIGVLLAFPWTVYAYEHFEHSWVGWFDVFDLPQDVSTWQSMWQFVIMAGVAVLTFLPWSLWLVGAAVQPFSASSEGERNRLLLAWLWLAATAGVLLLMPKARDIDDLAVLIAPMGLVVGCLFNQYIDLADASRYPRSWRWSRWIMCGGLGLGSVALPLAMYFNDELIRRGWLPALTRVDVNWLYAVGLLLALLSIVGLSLRYAMNHHPGRTMLSWCAWMFVALFAAIVPLSQSQEVLSPHRQEGQAIAHLTGSSRVFVSGQQDMIHPALSLYAEKALPPLPSRTVLDLLDEHDVVYVLCSVSRNGPPSDLIGSNADEDDHPLSLRLITILPGSRMELWQIRRE